MSGFIEGEDRTQATLFPERLEREAQRNVELMWLTGRLAPDQQLSLTDPDARSMTSRGSGMVGYNVQTAVDSEHHLIIAHEVTNVGSDRSQLATVAKQAKAVLDRDEPACTRLQHEASHQSVGNKRNPGGNPSISSFVSKKSQRIRRISRTYR